MDDFRANELRQKTRAALLSIASNTFLTILKLVAGIMMQSVSVISEAVHSGLDLLAALIAFFSVRKSGKPADHQHQYGHGKIENIAGIAEALLIFAATVYILVEAAEKLRHGRFELEELGLGAAIMGFSAVANFLVSQHLFRVARKTDSIALEADALHLRTDVYTSLGVFAGLIAIHFTGMKILDPLAAIAVALLILKAAYDLTRNALQNILDTRLPDEDESVIKEVLLENTGKYVEFHKLRTRKAGPVRYIDMHLVVSRLSTVEAGHRLSHLIAGRIEEMLPGSQVLVHIEPCDNRCGDCRLHCPMAPALR